jgi:uncharacterized protein (TIGR02266 family)
MGSSGRRGQRETRLPLDGVVRLRCTGRVGVHSGFLRDLSRGGMFLRLVDPEEAGTQLGFELSLPGRRHKVRGTGEVAWARQRYEGPGRPGGMAVRFVTLEVEGARELTDLLGAPPRAGVALVTRAALAVAGEPGGGFGPGAAGQGWHEEAAPDIRRAPAGQTPEGFAGDVKPTAANDAGRTAPPTLEPAALASFRSGGAATRRLDAAASARAARGVPPSDSEAVAAAPEEGAAVEQDMNVAGSRVGSRHRALLLGGAAVVLAALVWAGWRDLVTLRGAGARPTVPATGGEALPAGGAAPGTSPLAKSRDETAAAHLADFPAAIAGGGAVAGAAGETSLAEPATGAVAPEDREARATPARRLTGVRWEALPEGGTRLVLSFDGVLAAERVRSSRIGGDAPRLVLQLDGLEPATADGPWRPGTRELAAVRTGYHPGAGGGALHVVLDLGDATVVLRALEAGDGELRCDLVPR